MAVKNGHIELVQFLLGLSDKMQREKTDKNMMTPLHLAVQRGSLELVKILASTKDIVNKQNFVNNQDMLGRTALHLAVDSELEESKSIEIIRILMQSNSGPADPEVKDKKGLTVLTLAIRKEMHNVVRVLIRYGASLDNIPDGIKNKMKQAIEDGRKERGKS